MLRRQRGAQLLHGEEALLDQQLAVPLARLGRRLLGGLDLQRVHAIAREQDAREGVEAGEARGPAHVAGAEERADLADTGCLDGQRAARPRPEHRGHQLRDGRLSQVALRQGWQQLEGVHGRNILAAVPGPTQENYPGFRH